MTAAWPWLALAGLGAFHGVNPAMGWLFAVALGLHRKSRRAVVLALAPMALGHAVSIWLVAAVSVTASVAGALLIIIQPVEPSIGRDYIGRIFAICVLGGMTSFPGMLAGAMLIGIVESITATFCGPSWAPAVAFGFLLLTLAVRPAGILGR